MTPMLVVFLDDSPGLVSLFRPGRKSGADISFLPEQCQAGPFSLPTSRECSPRPGYPPLSFNCSTSSSMLSQAPHPVAGSLRLAS